MKKYLVILVVLATFIVGCDDTYLDVNKDPNNPTEVGPEFILPVAQNYTARWMHQDRRVSHLGNMMMYTWSEAAGYSWYNDEFQYRANASTFYSGIFDDGYTRVLKNYADLDDLDVETYAAYVAISKIMKSYTFQILVDFYGDIPYTDALQRSQNATPKYDKAQDVYDGLITDLTDAIKLLEKAEEESATQVVPSDEDFIYAGDLTSWKQFANTIKLRILTRESQVKDAAYITQELAVIAAEGSGYITADVEIAAPWSDVIDKQNPFWESFGKQPGGDYINNYKATCATDYIIAYMENTADPRINTIFDQPAGGHQGVQQGITADPATQSVDDVSSIGPGILKGPGQSSVIFTLAERYFNQAMLALEGFGGDPAALYDQGVSASFASLGNGSATNYLAQNANNVNYAFSSNKLEAIVTQKWIATIGTTGEQSWFDWSRTGFPSNLPVSVEVPNLVRPVRLSYPASEVGGNTANVPNQPNVFSTKIFWGN